MSKRAVLIGMFVILLAGATLTVVGEVDEDVSLSSAFEIWGDVLRDVDQFGLRLTRMSDGEEMEIGDQLSRQVLGWMSQDAVLSQYVAEVGEKLLPHVRRKGMRYQFYVVKLPQVNAFALPGGQVFVTTDMLTFLQSEAELAAIVGHEISHVDLRHCVERFQYQHALKKVGVEPLGQMAQIARGLLAVGYGKHQELEADAQGVRLSAEAGYDPAAAVDVFTRLQARFGPKQKRPPRTPIGELGQAVGQGLGSYFDSHPTSSERARRLQRQVGQYQDRLKGKTLYVGTESYQRRLQGSAPPAKGAAPGKGGG